ncbi:MAG TPA: hypothetical protein VFA07_05130 [Chthonomonadaceae bacterium]|nr:hypothetical protein [Chthonomonadaceae bacterium]
MAQACHGEPHALVTLGGAARGISEPWKDLLEYLRNSDRSVIRNRMAGDPRWEMLRPIEISVQMLPEPQRQRYLDLAVFPRGALLPEETILTFWKAQGLYGFPAREAIRDMVDRSLLLRSAEGRLYLHDHNVDYLQAMADDLPALHAKLLDAYASRCPDGWASGPNDGYFFQQLGYHLDSAGRPAEWRALLLDYRWLQAKLDATDIIALLTDYEQYLAGGLTDRAAAG